MAAGAGNALGHSCSVVPGAGTDTKYDQAPRHLLRAADLRADELETLLKLAATLEADPACVAEAFRGRLLACIFERASTRTRLAFAAAGHRLGLLPLMLSPTDLQLGHGEPVADTARAVSAHAAAVVVRASSHALITEFAAASRVPVVNALSDEHHPTEAIAALVTIRARFGHLRGLKLGYVGGGTNVATSLLEAASLAGMDVTLGCPPGHEPPAASVAAATAAARELGCRAAVVTDPVEAVDGCHVVYTDVWPANVGEGDAAHRRELFLPYRVDAKLMKHAAAGAVFLHCLPARRGEEVTADVIDGERSLVWEQVANQLPTALAVISWLLRDSARSPTVE
jgi:ornithine carbamoyltransferase